MVKVYSTTEKTEERWYSVELPHIATLIGMNFDDETHVLYAGEDNTNGFLCETDNKTILLYPYVNGSKASSNNYFDTISYAASATKYFFYSKTVDGYVFNFSNESGGETLKSGWTIATSNLTNENFYCYFGLSKKSCSKEGYYDPNFPNISIASQCASLYNYMPLDGRYYCKNLFLETLFPAVTDHIKFTINGKLFSSVPASGGSVPRIVVPLDESNW